MDKETVFVRTSKGEDEARSKTAYLFGDVKRALLMVDGVATFNDLTKRAAPSLRRILDEMFKELEKGGYIENIAKAGSAPKIVPSLKIPTRLKKPAEDDFGELDFTSVFRAPSPEELAAEAAKEEAKSRALTGAKVIQETEAARIRAEEENRRKIEAAKLRAQQEAEHLAKEKAEAARVKAEQEAAQARAELNAARAKAEAEAKARAEAEAKARQEIEAARLKARQEAEAARLKAEQEAAQVRAELEKARVEAKARAEAEAKARQDFEAARLKAQQEAEAVRLRAEQEAAKARQEAELARQQAAAEARAREEAERRAKEQAEAARLKAEQEAAQARAELEAAKIKAEAEAKARAEKEAKAAQEAEAVRLKAEQEAAKAREEAEAARKQAELEAAKAREEAEAARIKAEQEAARVRAELAAEREKAEAEAKARAEAEAKAIQEIEAARLKAQQETEAEQQAAKAREEAEFAEQQAEAEARANEEAERRASEAAEALQMEAEAKLKEEVAQHNRKEAEQAERNLKAAEEAEALLLQSARDTTRIESARLKHVTSTARSSSATVLFFDVVGYTKQPVKKQTKVKKQFNQLLSDCLIAQGDGEKIILDTGDGAAVGFLQHPEDALEVAMQFRKTVMANQHKDFPDLKVRIGIHLGPINIVQDMNGQSNMVGDGINDAQRIMSFAGTDQIYISRPYYDYVSRLSDEYDELFKYRGTQKDKHGREHSIYELVDTTTSGAGALTSDTSEAVAAMKLDLFSFTMPEPATSIPDAAADQEPEAEQEEAMPTVDMEQFKLPEETREASTGEEETAQSQPVSATPPPAESAAAEATPIETPAPAAKAHMPSAEEVAKLAESQSRIWAEAEQRAKESAKAHAERDVQPHVATPEPVERVRRKPIPWGKVGAGLFVVLLIALFAVPFVLPTQDYATRIEQLLSARLKQPVHIGHLAGRILPGPRLDLSDVSIGGEKQIQAQQVQVNFGLSALFASVKAIDSIELEGVQINGAALQQISTWLQQVAADPQYPVAHIKLNQGKLETDGIQLSGIGGELSFNPAGKFSQAKLHAEGSKFALDINATPENKIQTSFTARGKALPLLPNWPFDELNAKGELSSDELRITTLEGNIMGGIMRGDAHISWRSGWQAEGNLEAKSITMQNMSKALSGDMDGKANFQMQSSNFPGLMEAATLKGTFTIGKGVISGVDMVEAARLRSSENSPGGRTHFDELSGELSVANGEYAFRELKINAGVLNATGALGVSKRQLSGRISAHLTMRAGMGPVALQVGGTTDNPTLRVAR